MAIMALWMVSQMKSGLSLACAYKQRLFFCMIQTKTLFVIFK